MPFTKQQQKGVDYNGHALAIMAGAGTGKTHLLRGFASAKPTEKMIYICYNKSIQFEAEEKFRNNPNVMCRTLHGMAYSRYGAPLMHKLTSNIRLFVIMEAFKLNRQWDMARHIYQAFNNYLSSGDETLGKKHIEFLPFVTSNQKKYAQKIINYATKMWMFAKDPENPFPATHDVYLKLYCLEPPELHKWFDWILFDEAQDANRVVSTFILKQSCKKVVVGDEHQQLYRWRGAENAIQEFIAKEKADTLVINMSFRFGPKVGQLATSILDYKSKRTKSSPFPIKGNPDIEDEVSTLLPPSLLKSNHHARLHRTVMGTLKTALKFIDKKIYWVGGINKYNLDNLLDVFYLKNDNKTKIKNKKLLVDYKSYNDYKNAANATSDFEMLRTIKLVDEHQSALPAKLAKLKKNSIDDESKSDLTISTVHSSKGLEWEIVIIDDDFRDLLDHKIKFENNDVQDELNLLYVAITRSMKYLQINNLILGIIKLMNNTKVPNYLTLPSTKTVLQSRPAPKRTPPGRIENPQKLRLGD